MLTNERIAGRPEENTSSLGKTALLDSRRVSRFTGYHHLDADAPYDHMPFPPVSIYMSRSS